MGSDVDELKSALALATGAHNNKAAQMLALGETQRERDALRSKLADLPSGGVLNAAGRKAWDIEDWEFLDQDCPPTAHPSLWRMAQLNAISGLFQVCSGVYQLRGADYANMTLVQGQAGWIIIDPLMTAETSAAALKLANQTLGQRPVAAILYTHTHPDHFGGVRGVLERPDIPIYAPERFMEFAASEGVLGGNHTSRRAMYQFGLLLEPGPEGAIDGGIGKGISKGQRTFAQPTEFISNTGEERLIDGVRFIFQMADGTEAPAEITFLLPDHGVLCMAEVCTQTLHNILPARGAQIRDARLWSKVIDEALQLFADRAEILINSHNWPVWGAAEVQKFLSEQRDIYKYIHDQTLHLANKGHGPDAIAALMQEPEWLKEGLHARGYYGDMRFNAWAVYQFY